MTKDRVTEARMDSLLEELERLPADRRASLDAYRSAKKTLGLGRAPRFVEKGWKWTQRIGACLLLPLTAAIMLLVKQNSSGNDVKWAEVMVSNKDTSSLVLPDGSRIFINSGSRVTYPDCFAGDTREIFLDGEVRAEIVKDPEHPFIIRSGNLAVKVFGTTFDFKTYSKSDVVEVYLLEGSVEFDVTHDGSQRSVALLPGEYIQYSRSSDVIDKRKFSVNAKTSFTQGGSFNFRDIPFGDIARELEARFDQNIVIASSELESRRIFAIFSNNERIEQILASISASLGGLKITRVGDTWVISE